MSRIAEAPARRSHLRLGRLRAVRRDRPCLLPTHRTALSSHRAQPRTPSRRLPPAGVHPGPRLDRARPGHATRTPPVDNPTPARAVHPRRRGGSKDPGMSSTCRAHGLVPAGRWGRGLHKPTHHQTGDRNDASAAADLLIPHQGSSQRKRQVPLRRHTAAEDIRVPRAHRSSTY